MPKRRLFNLDQYQDLNRDQFLQRPTHATPDEMLHEVYDKGHPGQYPKPARAVQPETPREAYKPIPPKAQLCQRIKRLLKYLTYKEAHNTLSYREHNAHKRLMESVPPRLYCEAHKRPKL